ncbi:hypothetical protein M011DRAFT_471271, partial [Sporormia fimetaria CBS 119925]
MSGPIEAAAPLDMLESSASKLYAHIHPVLLLSLYAFRFNAIVADPVPGLSWTLLWLFVLQAAFALLCLPPYVGGTATTTREKKKPGEKRKKNAPGVFAHIWSNILLLCMALVLAAVMIAALQFALILFGAPVTDLRTHTFLCAAHMSVLMVIPFVYVHGITMTPLFEVVSLQRPIDEVQGAIMGTVVGAWAGAAPIPLDWVLDWQKWPITV